MRYLTFSLPGDRTLRVGVIDADRIIEVTQFSSMLALIQAGGIAHVPSGARSFAAGDVRWHAPIPRPLKNVFCLGRNYADHVKEAARARGQEF